MKNYNGVFAALVTPYDKSGCVNYTELKKLTRHLLKKGINGFYVCGSTAEAFMLTADERKQILEAVIEENKGEGTVIAHVGCISTDQAIELAKHAQAAGADAVSSVSPFYYKLSTDEICQYYIDIANSVDLPVFVYNFPANSGFTITSEILNRLIVHPNIKGVKHTCSDLFQLERMKSLKNDLVIWNGYDEILLSGLIAGADGGVGSTYNCIPEVYVELYKRFKGGDIKGAKELQHKANDVIECLIKCGVLQSVKYLLECQGFEMGGCRRPIRELTGSEKELLDEMRKQL